MKKMLKFFPLVVGIVLMSSSIKAQTVKLGHIQLNDVIALMPEVETAQKDLEKFMQTLDGQLKTMSAEYQTKVEDYQSKRELMAAAIRQTKEKEIVDLETRIKDFQQTAQENIQAKQQELFEPIKKKADEAVKAVAKENGFTYVLDSSAGIVIYSDDSTDLGPLVKKKLNLKDKPAAPAGVGSPKGAPVSPRK